ncbi:hypothetical protein NEOC65_001300 [Neochlamydia sp. AcF65]|nr:hypothetical protein [Neochlamydia sp. AcF65]
MEPISPLAFSKIYKKKKLINVEDLQNFPPFVLKAKIWVYYFHASLLPISR